MNTDSLIQYTAKDIELSTSAHSNFDGHQNFKIENITVIQPPLLKVFFWQFLNIDGLNRKILSDAKQIEHDLHLPALYLNRKPLKIVFWLRNLSEHPITLSLKRLQNCQCLPLETRVGFNQFRYLYHCPHRRLINISQELYQLQPDELVAMTMVAYFYILGSYVLSYELSCSDSRVIVLNFHVNIVTFNPAKSILTHELIPVNIREHRRMAQAVWIRNITMQNLQFRFMARNRGFRLINSNMTVPRQSVWPLIVDYRPSDSENELNLIMVHDGIRYNIPLTCKGIFGEYTSQADAPINDYECSDFLYVVYPNKLDFHTELNDERSLMVAVHNHNQKCMEFKWQPYSINGYFTFAFEPAQFTLKPHHSKLCVVHCRTFDKPLHFRYLPAVLEVHRILDKSTQIAQQLLTEIESIDDLKWKQDSYMEHVFLQIDLKVNFSKLEPVQASGDEETRFPLPLIIPTPKNLGSSMKQQTPRTTIFEKLFWDYLSRSTFMRKTGNIPRNLTYEEVLLRPVYPKTSPKPTTNDRIGVLSYISYIVAESCRDLSKNYIFVPKDILEPL